MQTFACRLKPATAAQRGPSSAVKPAVGFHQSSINDLLMAVTQRHIAG